MSDNHRKPMNHGELLLTLNTPAPRPYIPRVLRLGIVELNIPHELAVAKYGVWELRAIRDVFVRGKNMACGDTFKVPGNEAVMLTQARDAVFTCDVAREKEESEILERARKLGLPVDIKSLAEFATNRKEDF